MIPGQARALAARALRSWPEGAGGTLSARHAARVWEAVRADVIRGAGGLAGGVGGAGVEGAARLAFLAGLGEHVDGCARCVSWGLDGVGAWTGEQWLVWAVGRDEGLAVVWRALRAGRGGRLSKAQ